MLQVTEVDCVRHPEELKASHGNYDIGSIMEVRKEKPGEMVCVKCLQKHTDRTSGNGSHYLHDIICIFIEMQKIVFEGERWEVNQKDIS